MKKSYLLLFVALFSLSSCGGDATFEYHTDDQLGYIKDESYSSIDKYTISLSPVGTPLAKEITWSLTNAKELLISEQENLANSIKIDITNLTKYDFYNCKSETTYFYKVKSDSEESKVSSFITSGYYPRNINVDGVKNIRDLGSKNHIKQGLIYRGGEFNYLHAGKMKDNIKENGKLVMNTQLKIKSEIDLRFNDETVDIISPLGENVTYYHYPLYYKGDENILTYKSEDADNPSVIKDIFETLSDSSNYPVYFHCAKGKDRTGLISYLLKGLMGEDINDIYKDYLFTNFTFKDAVKMDDILNNYVPVIEGYKGANLQEKINNYLVEVIKVQDTSIAKIKNIIG